MKKYSIRDYKKRKQYNKIEWKNLVFKYLFSNFLNKKGFRIIIFNFFINKVIFRKLFFKNRCVFFFDVRTVTGFFRISTLRLKEFYSKNIIPGIRKSSW